MHTIPTRRAPQTRFSGGRARAVTRSGSVALILVASLAIPMSTALAEASSHVNAAHHTTSGVTWQVNASTGVDPSDGSCPTGNVYRTIRYVFRHDCPASGDVVSVAAGTYAGGFTIKANVNLNGSSTTSVVISGAAGGAPVITVVAAASSPEIDNLTIANAQSQGPGGGIYNKASFTQLFKVTLKRNAAVDGGGIYNAAGGTVDLRYVHFMHNTATNDGGGFYNGGDVAGNNVTFDGNQALNGGGVFATGSGYTDLGSGKFLGNSATNDGGAAALDGGLLQPYGFTMTSNRAGHNGGGIANGGDGLAPGTLILGATGPNRPVSVTGNTATAVGGGVYNTGSLSMEGGSSISGNTPDDCVDAGGGTGC